MAWHEIMHKCGHSGRRQITGPTRDRDRKATWYGENHVCENCYRRDKAAQPPSPATMTAHVTLHEVPVKPPPMRGGLPTTHWLWLLVVETDGRSCRVAGTDNQNYSRTSAIADARDWAKHLGIAAVTIEEK